MDIDEIRRKRIRLYAGPLTDTRTQNSSIVPRIKPAAAAMSAEEGAWSSRTSRGLKSFRETIETRCAACESPNVDLEVLVRGAGEKLAESSDSTVALDGTKFCLRCCATTCLGCGEICTKERAAAGHCARERLVRAWVLLCAFDQKILHNSVQERSGRKKPANKKSAKGPPPGVGYGGVEWTANDDYDDYDDHEEQYLPPPGPPPGWMPSNFQGAGQTLGSGNTSAIPPLAPFTPGPLYSYTPAIDLKNSDYFTMPLPQVQSAGQTLGQSGLPPSHKPPSPPVSHPAPGFDNAGNLSYDTPWTVPILPVDNAENATIDYYNPYKRSKREKKQEEVHINPNDAILAKTTSTISPLVSDPSLPSLLHTMLARSSLLDCIAELLRNDSIEDIAARASVYGTVISMTKILASQSTTSSFITADRCVNRDGQDVYNVPSSNHLLEVGEQEAKKLSISTCVRDLVTQSRVMLGIAEKMSHDFQTGESKKMLSMCQQVLDLQQIIEQASRVKEAIFNDQESGKAFSWQKEFALRDVPDDQILNCHAYGKEALTFSNLPKGRARRLVQEITSLTTSLPEGIFIRHGTSRLDVMKILITGPAGTPYENGLFEFDLLCGAEYPDKPPKMQFRTTGGGRAHFNPNLYQDGKVCLSLLGTWDGEPWHKKKSTLLQLLISVQAFILNDEPICNEPGNESFHGRAESREYNHSLYPLTIRYAIIDWLEKDKETATMVTRMPHSFLGPLNQNSQAVVAPELSPLLPPITKEKEPSIWQDIVKHHFATKEATITKTLDRWMLDVAQAQECRKKRKSVFVGTGPMGMALGDGSSVAPQAEASSETESDFLGRLKSAYQAILISVGPVRDVNAMVGDFGDFNEEVY